MRSIEENNTKKTLRSSLPLILIPVISMITATFIVCGYVMLSLIRHWEFSFFTFYSLTIPLLIAVIISLSFVWKKRHYLSINTRLLMIEWASAVFWYWVVGIAYQFATTNINTEQLRVVAFGYYWEVFIIAGITYTISQIIFMPITRYVASGHTNNPEQLYRRMLNFPINVAIRMSVFTIVGYTVGTLQVYYFSDSPIIETYKNIGVGAVLSLFVAIFQYLIIDNFLGPTRVKLVSQYKIKNAYTRKYSSKVFGVILILTIASFSLLIMVFMQSFQSVTRDNLKENIRNDITKNIALSQNDSELIDNLKRGENGKVWLLDVDQPLPLDDVTGDTQRKFLSMDHGSVRDLKNDIKLIVFDTHDNKKITVLVHEADFYRPLYKMFVYLAICGFLIVILTIIALLIFNSVLTRAMSNLTKAVSQAEKRSKHSLPVVDTGDEFQVLSEAFDHYVHENQEYMQRIVEEQTRLKSSIKNLQLGFIMFDSKKNIMMFNTAAQKILFDKKTSNLPESLDELDNKLKGNLSFSSHVKKCYESERAVEIESVEFDKKFLHMFITPVIIDSTDQIIGCVVVIQDITEAKILERTRDEFFSIASHELRTPLTAIVGNMSMMKSYYGDVLKDPELKEMVNDVQDSGRRLIKIVNDFLDTSRLELGKIELTTSSVNIVDMCESIIKEFSMAQPKQSQVVLSVQKPDINTPNVLGDRDRIRQVIVNLVGNSLKFTESGKVTLKFSMLNDMVEVAIEDTGKGIPKEYQNLLFRKFQQATSSILTRDNTRSTGLGLYISRLLIEQMEGKIYLEKSAPNEGTTFVVLLKVAPADFPETEPDKYVTEK